MEAATEVRHQTVTAQYRELVSAETFDRLVGRIVKDEGVKRQLAEEIMESALCFLKISADNTCVPMSPSPLVDIGWHTFILYTRPYAAFCERVAGRFIHHEPNDIPGAPQKTGGVQRTIGYMDDHGIAYNQLLWTGKLATAAVMTGSEPSVECGTVDCDNGGGPPSNCTCS